jgi:hypothetical protein
MSRLKQSPRSSAAEPSPTSEEDHLHIDHWPQGWRVESEDIALGKVMVDLFKVFLTHQSNLSRSRKTLRVHRDNLRTLGGHIIRLLHEKPPLRKRGILRVLLEAIDEDGGPLVYPALTDSAQRSLDSTCRLLHRFTLLG